MVLLRILSVSFRITDWMDCRRLIHKHCPNVRLAGTLSSSFRHREMIHPLWRRRSVSLWCCIWWPRHPTDQPCLQLSWHQGRLPELKQPLPGSPPAWANPPCNQCRAVSTAGRESQGQRTPCSDADQCRRDWRAYRLTAGCTWWWRRWCRCSGKQWTAYGKTRL